MGHGTNKDRDESSGKLALLNKGFHCPGLRIALIFAFELVIRNG